jgi:F420-0:gamma-glutamyl ligase-like protein
MEIFANPGKKLIVEIEGKKFARYPIKTHFIETSDDLEKILEKYVLPIAKKGDIIVLCQKIISILQKRIVYKKDLKVGFFAKFLSKFARKTPAGYSVGNPLKMQLAINLAGLPRILFACFLSAIFKIFRIYGIFYLVAGHQISQIDGFYGEAFPEYAKMGILGPLNCDKICQKLKEKYNLSFLIADVNDLGRNILGKSEDLKGKEKLILEILKDNPAGQSNEKTPILILRKIT